MERLSFFRWWITTWPHRWHVRRQVPSFLRSCPEPFRGEVLELGAGRGYTSQKILQTFPQVELTAVDIEQHKHLQKLQQRFGRRLKVAQANIFSLPFDREEFDIAIAINVLPHLQAFSVRKAIQEALRVLRPGGLLGISDRSLIRPYHEVTRETIIGILQQEQCEILEVEGSTYYQLWARKPYPIPPAK